MAKPYNPYHPNVLLVATGSVATIKLPTLISHLHTHPLNLRLVLAPSAVRFLAPETLSALPVQVFRNADEWAKPWVRGDSVLHIELRKWADVMVIAPLSANSLAGMAGGFCNGLALSIVRAWDTKGLVGDRGEGNEAAELEIPHGVRKKILVAPAMNTHMYVHPLTEEHLRVLRGWHWVEVLEPVAKMLACGDIGVGGMMEVGDIVDAVLRTLYPRERDHSIAMSEI